MRHLLLLLVFALYGCGAAQKPGVAPLAPVDPFRLEETIDLQDGVGTFTSTPDGFDTNSFWIEGTDGVIVLDTQFLPSEVTKLLDALPRRTHKPIVLAVVLHPNPDKFNGSDLFRARGIPVVTAPSVLAAIPAVAAQRRRAFARAYAPDYPDHDPTLTAIDFGGGTSTVLHAAGIDLRLDAVGAGCSEAHLIASWKGHVFAGDLLISKTHAWLELGYLDAWLTRLDEIGARTPRRLHPGRGPSGGAELLEESRRYLLDLKQEVARLKKANESSESAIAILRAYLQKSHPGYAYPVFLHGLAGVWKRAN